MALRFLVVDDEPAIASGLARFLSRSYPGSEVRTATSNMTAFEVLGDFNPTLITTDLTRHDGDGYEFFNALRQQPKTAHTPVIVLTARSDDELKAYRHGFNAVLLKPFELQSLIECINRVLRLRTNPDLALIHLGFESQALDYKETIDLKEKTSRAALAKDIIAMANWGGGTIVVGVAEPNPGEFVPVGLPDHVLANLETSRLARAVQEYLDPPLPLTVRRVRDGAHEFVFIAVPPSKGSVVLAAMKNENAGLYPGRIYSRTARAESAEVQVAAELRDLLTRMLRGGGPERNADDSTLAMGHDPQATPSVPS